MTCQSKKIAKFKKAGLYNQKENNRRIAAMIYDWEAGQKAISQDNTFPFITISRHFGCKAFETGLLIADILNQKTPESSTWAVFDEETVQWIAKSHYISNCLISSLSDECQTKTADYMNTLISRYRIEDRVTWETIQTVRALCQKGHVIVIGQGGCKIAEDLPKGFHVRIVAMLAWRLKQAADFYDIPLKDARKKLDITDASRKLFFLKNFNQDIADQYLYDMVLKEADYSIDSLVSFIIDGMADKGLLKFSRQEPVAINHG